MKIASISTIGFGIAVGVVAYVVDHGLNLIAAILLFQGIYVRHRNRTAALWAMVFSAPYVLSGVAAATSIAVHGIREVDRTKCVAAVILSVWACLNLALLSRICRLPATRTRPDSTPEPPTDAALPPFQFTLRWALLATVIVAIGCWAGTRLVTPYDDGHDGQEYWKCFSSPRGTGLWSVGIIRSRSGTPLAGYLWRSEGQEAENPDCVSIQYTYSPGRGHAELLVNGEPVRPGEDFQLFVNDLQDKPMRLIISRKKALEFSGLNPQSSNIDKFWNEVVEPARRNSPAPEPHEASRSF